MGLNQDTHLGIILTELLGGKSLSLFKDAVEIRQVIESALVADFGNSLAGVHQLA